MILHGTTGSGASMLTPIFAGELFGPGQPIDATKYFIILPDSMGHGKTAKPSDSLRAKFPQYDYDDMVSEDTRGHLTAAFAKFWKQQVQDLLQTAPRQGP